MCYVTHNSKAVYSKVYHIGYILLLSVLVFFAKLTIHMENFNTEETKPILKVDNKPCSTVSSIRKTIEGVSLALLASLIFTFNGIIVKYFKLDSVDVVAVRSILQIIVLALIIKTRGKSPE